MQPSGEEAKSDKSLVFETSRELRRFVGEQEETRALRSLASVWDFWPFHEVARSLVDKNNRMFYLADARDGRVMMTAAAFFSTAVDQADLLYVFSLPSLRQKGLGRSVLEKAIEELKIDAGILSVSLEVRVGNARARALYKACGFTEIKTRHSYYADGEDAVIMQKRSLD